MPAPTTELPPEYRPEFDSLVDRLLELGRIRSPGQLLQRVVECLVERPHVALARIWLVQPGDQCATCAQRRQCPSQERCLHLVASAGRSRAGADWSGLDGPQSRVPLGRELIGRIGVRGEPLVVRQLAASGCETGREAWMNREDICGIDLQPIRRDDEVIGVLGIFTRIPTPERGPAWARILADHVAGALANARAFAEIERLRSRLELENSCLRDEVREARGLERMVGSGPAMRELRHRIALVAGTDATVLITGESGTGKELVAREIHAQSRRQNQPLIRVNCPAIPRDLYESEFFGHVRGAFTGALRDRAGRFEAADGGTLFLDEIGDIPLELQSKLLRVLQEKQFERVGEERTRTVDVRVIAASNRDLAAAIAAGRFRQDLYYRLNVVPIDVPPLRSRREDIPELAAHFLEQAVRRFRLPARALTTEDLRELNAHDWPGNVRELQHTIERAVILARDGPLPFDVPRPAPAGPTASPAAPIVATSGGVWTEQRLREFERANLAAALEQCHWRIHGRDGAATLLGLRPSTLTSRLRKLGLVRPE